jgi:hypothetical protein
MHLPSSLRSLRPGGLAVPLARSPDDPGRASAPALASRSVGSGVFSARAERSRSPCPNLTELERRDNLRRLG